MSANLFTTNSLNELQMTVKQIYTFLDLQNEIYSSWTLGLGLGGIKESSSLLLRSGDSNPKLFLSNPRKNQMISAFRQKQTTKKELEWKR